MTILLADDNRDLAEVLTSYLESEGNKVVVVSESGLDVISAYELCQPDVVLMDVMLPRFSGIAISQAILSKYPKAKLILMSGKLHAAHPFVAASGARRFLAKPLKLSDVKAALEDVVALKAAVA